MNPSSTTDAYWRKRRSVFGAFLDIDFLVFDRILSEQERSVVTGDLLEIGAWCGQSAIVLGLHARSDEETIVCDVFGDTGINDANTLENAVTYANLSRDMFEANYVRWVVRPARIVQELSAEIRSHVKDDSLRFAHIDGGHHYDVVADDIRNVKKLLSNGGVLALDDFRALHTPGVAAATWESVANDGLIPFCATEQKLYATWSAPTANSMAGRLADWVKQQGTALNAGIQDVAGHKLLLIENPHGTSMRNRVGRMIPPAVRTALRGRVKPYLGRPL
jgi:SAM-dependent methyltransferase